MRAVLRMDGSGSSIIMHNERLADPLDEITRAMKAFPQRKTDAQHLELGKLEFMGGLYTNGNGPCLPAWNIIRCLQEGAKRQKRGKDVLRGVHPLAEHADLLYDGPRDPEKLWLDRSTFSLRKGVGVGGRKIIRTRPIFQAWACELAIEIDPLIFNLDTLRSLWADSGTYEGLGDMRPIYGRFVGTVLSEQEWLKQADGKIRSVWDDNKTQIKRILKEDADRKARH